MKLSQGSETRRLALLPVQRSARCSVVAILVVTAISLVAADDKKVLDDPSFKRTGELLNAGKYEEAVNAVSQAIQKHPKASQGYRLRAVAYIKSENFDAAVADIEKALQYSKGETYSDATSQDAASVYVLRGRNLASKGDPIGATADFDRALALNPTLWLVYLSKGMTEYDAGRFTEAIADLNRWMAKESDESLTVIALTVQGRCYQKLGQESSARANVRRIIDIDPRLAIAYGDDTALDLYDIEKRHTLTREAIAAAERADRVGNAAEAFRQFELARQWPLIVVELPDQRDLPDYSKADAELLRGVESHLLQLYPKLTTKPALPESARRFAVQAESATKDKRPDDAISLYQKALGIAPWWPLGNFNLALLFAGKNQLPQAAAQMTRYIALAPDAPDARQAQDRIYEWEGKSKAASMGPPLDSLAGAWVYTLDSQGLQIAYTFEMTVTGDNQLELNPVRYRMLRGPRAFASEGDQPISRATSGYYALTRRGLQMDGLFHLPSGKTTPMSGELARDGSSMTLTAVVNGKSSEQRFIRQR